MSYLKRRVLHVLWRCMRYTSANGNISADILTRQILNCNYEWSSSLQKRCASSQNSEVRVRFAPSPTGYLHLGGLRTALYNFLFAKKHGGTFILRMEDTDQSRLVSGAADSIEDMLEWAGIGPNESPRKGGNFGPYQQSERLDKYRQAAETLVQNGAAYYCFCSPQRLDLLKKEALRSRQNPRYDNRCRHLHPNQVAKKLGQGIPHVIRFRLEEGVEPFEDMVFGRNKHEVAALEGDPVIIKGDGFPTYHLANVVDDHLMRVSHVLRGSEWLISTSKHLLMYKAFGWTPPVFGHLPLLLNKDGSKFSKRQGDIYIEHFVKTGCLPEALHDLITNCGSGFTNNRPGRVLDELISDFDASRLMTHSAVLDMDKLPEFNRIHLVQRINDGAKCDLLVKDLERYIRQTHAAQIQDMDVLRYEYIKRVLHLRKGHIVCLQDLLTPDYTYLWVRPCVQWKHLHNVSSEARAIITLALEMVKAHTTDLTTDCLNLELKELAKKLKTSQYSTIMKILRLALSGLQQGPSVAEMMVCLGPAEICHRLQSVLEH